MTPARRRAVRRANRRVRIVVDRFGGCLSELPTRQRKVLRLRAGVGPREPASRTAVARRLDLGVKQVQRAERRGLRALKREGEDGCVAVGAGGPLEGGADMAGGDGALVLASGGAAAVAAAIGRGGDEGGASRGTTGTGGEPGNGSGSSSGSGSGSGSGANGGVGSGGVRGATAVQPRPGGGAATDITLPFLLVILLGAGAFGAWRLYRSQMVTRAD